MIDDNDSKDSVRPEGAMDACVPATQLLRPAPRVARATPPSAEHRSESRCLRRLLVLHALQHTVATLLAAAKPGTTWRGTQAPPLKR